MKLWARIATALAVNLLLLGALTVALIMQQSRSGVDSFLYAPARERVRDLGRQVEEEFPGMSAAERSAWISSMQEPLGVTLAVFDDTGTPAGLISPLPESVQREVRRERRRDPEGVSPSDRLRPGRRRGRGNNPPMFLVKENGYWIGYHFPVIVEPGKPPVRHTLVVSAPSLWSSSFFFDWTPWFAGASVALVVTVACWVPVVRRFSRSLNQLQAASAEIARGRFDVEIPVKGKDEFASLAVSIKQMAAQLSEHIHGQQRFLASVAHELCAPLSRIQLSTGILERLTEARGRTAIDRLERDVAYMSALAGDLLSFTRGAVRNPEIVPLQLSSVVNEVIGQETEGAHGALVTSTVDPGLTVLADREYLTRATGNVIRNAILYAGEAGPILIEARRSSGKISLSVQDRGPGLPEASLDSVFHPFFKPDGARTPGSNGAGLGLSIVKSCVEACGGSVSCRNRTPKGLAVTFELDDARAES